MGKDDDAQRYPLQLRRELDTTFDFPPDIPPPILYHYTTSAALMGILRSKELWATHFEYLNDPSELRHGVDAARGWIEEELNRGNAEPNKRGFLSSLAEQLVNPIDRYNLAQYVISFSTQADSLPQWRAYGENGRGCALGIHFSPSDSVPEQQPFIATVQRCTYDADSVKSRIQKVLTHSWNAASRYFATVNSEEMAQACFLELVLWTFEKVLTVSIALKNAGYATEDEWRLLVWPKANRGEDLVDVRMGSTGLIPFMRFSIPEPPRVEVRKIVLGPMHDQRHGRQTVEILLKRAGFEGVAVEKSDIPYRPA